MSVMTEFGLYRLVISSNKRREAKAAKFCRDILGADRCVGGQTNWPVGALQYQCRSSPLVEFLTVDALPTRNCPVLYGMWTISGQGISQPSWFKYRCHPSFEAASRINNLT